MIAVFHFPILFLLLFLIELFYVKLAERLKFVNYRSPQNNRIELYSSTIRGGGFIFVVSVLLSFYLFSLSDYFFLIALMLLSIISFLDDFINVNFKVRLMFHGFSTLLLLYQFNLFSLPIIYLFFICFIVVATINAYNFMDGINGITGSYSLLTIGTLYYLNKNIINFTTSGLLIVVGLSLLVFNFFNFRKRARCFAGDVGSVSIAFIIIFLIGDLILASNNLPYILLLLVYGIDTSFTVIFRAIRRENIFEAHRSHFYQYLANDKKWSHLLIASLYSFFQLLINLILIYSTSNFAVYATFSISVLCYMALRLKFEGKKRLFSSY